MTFKYTMLGILLAAGCTTQSQDTRPVAEDEYAVSTAIVDIISPGTCRLFNGKLKNCVIPTSTLAATPIDTAVPVRTTIRRQKSGTCSTTFSVQVTAAPSSGQPVDMRYLSQESIELRSQDGSPLSSVTIRDSSPWTPSLLVDQSCRVSLSVEFNVPDVDSKEEAESVLYHIQREIDDATQLRDRYRELVLFSSAYSFMQQVATNFHTELSNEAMQLLRTSATAAAPALETLISSCGAMAEADRGNLLDLYFSLGAVGDASSWTNPDGSTKTLAEFLGPEAQEVIATVNRILSDGAQSGNPQYPALYREAAQRVEELKAKFALASAELSSWLS